MLQIDEMQGDDTIRLVTALWHMLSCVRARARARVRVYVCMFVFGCTFVCLCVGVCSRVCAGVCVWKCESFCCVPGFYCVRAGFFLCRCRVLFFHGVRVCLC